MKIHRKRVVKVISQTNVWSGDNRPRSVARFSNVCGLNRSEANRIFDWLIIEALVNSNMIVDDKNFTHPLYPLAQLQNTLKLCFFINKTLLNFLFFISKKAIAELF